MKSRLLLLHGALGSKQQFLGLKEILANEYELFELNFEGHGGTPSENEFSIELFTSNLMAFFQANQLDQMDVFGYSMGGYVALNLARQQPELIRRIITLGTKFDWNPASAQREVKMLNPEKVEEKVPRFAEKLARDHAPQDWKVLMRKTAQMMLAMGGGERLGAEHLGAVSHPVFVGLGSEDKMVSKEESEWALSNLPNGKLMVLEGVPHPLEKADPRLVADFIRSSLA